MPLQKSTRASYISKRAIIPKVPQLADVGRSLRHSALYAVAYDSLAWATDPDHPTWNWTGLLRWLAGDRD